MWLHSRDPLFKEKVNDVVGLYLEPPTDAVVLCVDENRARLTQLRPGHYRLDMAGHGGRWESTPYEGTLRELLAQFADEFGFVLVPRS